MQFQNFHYIELHKLHNFLGLKHTNAVNDYVQEVMSLNAPLKHSVLANIDECGFDEVLETILDAVESGEEATLPGLGVLFEILWQASDESARQAIVSKIVSAVGTKAV